MLICSGFDHTASAVAVRLRIDEFMTEAGGLEDALGSALRPAPEAQSELEPRPRPSIDRPLLAFARR